MSSLERRCLVGSAAAHAGLVGLLLIASWVAARRVIDGPNLPPLEIVSLQGVRLTDGSGAGGGTPTPPPPPPQNLRNTPSPTPPTPSVPRVNPSRDLHTDPPPRTAPRQETGVRVSQDVKRAQDIDDRLKGASATEEQNRTPRNRAVQVATNVRRVDPSETAAAREAAQRAQAEARAQAAREAQDQWRKAVGSVFSKLNENLSGETSITVPGPGGGGEVWVGYATYLKSFYEMRWRRPSSLPVPVAYVGISITVSRDGRVLRSELLEKSGIRELDASVNEVIQRYRTLEPLPSGSSDAERTFRIKFRLEGTTP